LVDKCPKIVVLGDEEPLLTYRPGQNGGIFHMWIYVTDEDGLVARFLKGVRYPSTHIMVNEELHTGVGR
jgi:hypothetical protein